MPLLRLGNRLIPLLLIIFIVGVLVSRFNGSADYQDKYMTDYHDNPEYTGHNDPPPVPAPVPDNAPLDFSGLTQQIDEPHRQAEKDTPKQEALVEKPELSLPKQDLPPPPPAVAPVDTPPKADPVEEVKAKPVAESPKQPTKTAGEHAASPAQAVTASPSLMKHGGGKAPAPRSGVLLAVNGWLDPEQTPVVDDKVYNRLYSQSTKDKRYFDVKMGRYKSYNPNILPHPSLKDTYVLVCQHEKALSKDPVFAQMACNAAFNDNGVLDCVEPPMWVPYAGTNHKLVTTTITSGGMTTTSEEASKCTGGITFLNFNVGPHDARVFWGPDRPYTMFGSNSDIICFSQWIQDFRQLFLGGSWKSQIAGTEAPISTFANETEIQRPPPAGDVEKNWFIFWDDKDQAYVHHDSTPRRVFAKLKSDGTVGENLALNTADLDNPCLEKLMPDVAETLESIHQATNSLAVTLCKRADPACKATPENTMIMQIFHWKSYYLMHGAYEPYVMLFHQRSPFELYGISEKALWIEGRRVMNNKTSGNIWRDFDPWSLPKNHTEMIYITSITWKDPGQRYHGYLDDTMFLGFGIEDKHAGAIDVLAGDVLLDMGLCKEGTSLLGTGSGSSQSSSSSSSGSAKADTAAGGGAAAAAAGGVAAVAGTSEGSTGSPGLSDAHGGAVGAGAAAPPPGRAA